MYIALAFKFYEIKKSLPYKNAEQRTCDVLGCSFAFGGVYYFICMKDPAFLFYSSDFLTGTMIMTFEDRGKYITILSYMHQNGRLSEETIRLLVGSVSDMLRLKFSIDKKGFWFNERLEIEIEKRRNFVESRQENGKKGGRPAKKEQLDTKPTGYPTHNLTEDVNKDENINEFKGIDIRGISLKILTDFKFNEITHQNKLSQISGFIRKLIADNLIDNFVTEYQSYWDYKRKSNSQLQSLETFISDGWQREVWTEKLKTYNNGQQFTREGKQQSIAELREANRKFLNNYKSQNGS